MEISILLDLAKDLIKNHTEIQKELLANLSEDTQKRFLRQLISQYYSASEVSLSDLPPQLITVIVEASAIEGLRQILLSKEKPLQLNTNLNSRN